MMHSLPPDFESSTGKTYGILSVKIGNLFWQNMNSTQNLPNSLIKLKFWGENHDGLILKPRNSNQPFPSEAKYEIKVGILNFQKYLEDMAKIKLVIFERKSGNQIGHVLINLLLYLNRNLQEYDLSSFNNNVDEVFPIIKSSKGKEGIPQKIGEIDVMISCLFEKSKQIVNKNIEMRGKYARSNKISPKKDANSSFLLNEIKSQQEIHVANKENLSENQLFQKEEDYQSDQEVKEQKKEMRFAKSLQPERQQIYETANFQELQPLQKKSNITIEEEIQYPQKITKEGLMVPNNGELNHPSKIDEILSKAKNLQNKLNNFQFDVKPTIASNNNNNFLLSFQAKREENQLKPFLFDTLISDNKLIEYPIEKIGDIISKKSLNPELESQKLKLDEAGYMDTFERKEKKKKNMIEEPAILLMENRSNQKKFERDTETANMQRDKHFESKNLKFKIIKLICTHQSMLEKFRKTPLSLLILVDKEISQNILLGQFQKERELKINQEFDLARIDSKQLRFKINSSFEKITMELAKGQININLAENGIEDLYTIKMFSGAIPDQISNKEKPKIIKMKKFKEDTLKKIDTETLIGELQFQIIEEIKEKEKVKKVQYMNIQKEPWIERESPIYFLFLNIDRISNLEALSNIFIRYKVYSSLEKIETPTFFNITCSIIDYRISMPMNSNSIQKTEKVPFVLEIWNKQENDNLVGLVHLDLKSIYSSYRSSGSSLELNKFPLIVYDDSLNIKAIGMTSPKGILTISLAFGTLIQISKYEQALKDKNKLNDQNNKMNYNNLINPNETKNDEFKFHSENKLSNSEKEKKNFYNMNQYQENLSQNNILNENKHSKPHFLDVSDLKEDRQNEEENQFEFILTDKILIKFLKNLTKHRESLSNEFKQLLESISKEKNNLSIESFGNFLSNSRFNLTKKEIATIIKIFDYDNVKIFPSIDFLESYKAVLLLEENIQSKMKEICQVFELALSRNQLTLTAFEKELSKRSDFGYIQKSAFEGYIRNDLRISEETFKNLDTFFMFSELILISGFIEKILLVQSGSNSNSLLNLMDASVLGMQIIEKILLDLRKNPEKTKDFLEFLLEINKNLESQEENKNQFLKIREIITLFQANGLNLTFIEVFFILKTINFSQRKKNIDKTMGFEHQIETKLFSEFFIEKLKGLMDQPRLLSPILQKIKIEENDFDEINDLNTLLNEKKAITIENNENESKAQIENEDKEVNINYLMKNTEETNRRTGDRENEEINEKLQKPIFDIKNLQENDDKFEKPITAYQHQLKLKCYWLENCELEKSYEGGNLTLRYKFPNEENIIESKAILYDQQKKNYEIYMKSSHSINLGIREDIKSIINDKNAILIQMICSKNQKEEIIAKAIIPIEIFFLNEPVINSEKAKSIQIFPLWLEEKDSKFSKLMGKLHFKFTYKKTPIEDENLFSMKQMKFQKFLPKKGFLNISIEKISNVKSLIESQNFEKNASLVSNREFYTCIYCEPFYEDEDLNSLFIGFETPAIYEKLAYGLNFIKNYAITMNSVILEYFQTKRLKLELRLFFKESEDYIILGYFEIPLIGLILNVNGLIDEDFCLKSENAQFCDVFVKINMSLTEKPLNIQNKLNVLPSKPFGIVLLQLIEIIYDEDAFEEFKEINFSLTFQQKTYKTGKFQIGNNTNGFVFLNNANFMMKTSNSQIFTLQPIEIKLIANENTVLGYLNIDFAETMKPNKDSFYVNGYLLVNDPDCLKSNSIKMRIGLKCVGFFFENEGLLERNQTFIEKLDPKNCFNIQKMMKASKEINVWEAAKIVLNLSQFELNKLNLLFENFDNVQSVFSNDIGEHLTQERKIEGYEVRKELLKEFCFYDYENCGYIDIDNAQRIFSFFGETLKFVKKEKIKQFSANNINLHKIDSNTFSLKIGYKFDYLLFLHKIFEHSEPLYDPNSVYGYNKIYRNSEMIEKFFTKKTQLHEISSPLQFEPFILYIKIISAHNLDALNKGQIPNSFLYNERLKLKTEMCYRIKDPEINYSFTLEVNSAKDLEFDLDLYFRNFNSQDKEHIYNDNKIASIYINLFEIYSQLQNKKEIIISHSFNEYTSVMIKYSLFPNINNCEFTQTVNTHYNGEKNEELEDNEFLTNELIENFHKTLNEINNDICVIDNFLPSNQKALSHNIDNTNNNKPKLHTQKKELEEIDESPQKLEKTILELDELKKNLNQILETKKTYSENGKGFSFGEENNNPFANFLYQSNLQVKHEFNSHSIPEKIDYKIEEVKEMSSAEKNDKIFDDKYDNTNDFEKNLIFDKKPPLSKNSSLKNLKLLDDSLKNKQEFERIAKIMKGNFDKSKKFSDFSSDSDC